MPRISIGDCHLHYERHGAGFPVLFISGLNGHGAYWRDQVPAFAKSFEVVLHDQRGIGQSDHTRTAYTVERMAGDVVQLMDALGIAKAHIVGHSTGGAMAQVLALEHPQRLASVVIAASWTKGDAHFRRLFAPRRHTCRPRLCCSIQASGSRATTSGCGSSRRSCSPLSRRRKLSSAA